MKHTSEHDADNTASTGSPGKFQGESRTSSIILYDGQEGLTALVDNMQEEVWYADAEKRLVFVNKAVIEEFGPEFRVGIGFDKIEGGLEIYRSDGTVCPREEMPLFRALNGEIVQPQEELAYIPAKGEFRHRLVGAVPVKSREDKIVGSVALVRDVTHLKRTEQQLRESEQRYGSLAEVSPDAVIVHRQNEFLYANPAALKLYGAENFEQLKQKKVFDFLAPEFVDSSLEILKNMEEGRPLPTMEARLIRFDGQEVYVETHAAYVIYGQGRAVQVVLRDITERKRTEASLREANATLERKIKERTAELAQRAAQLRALAGELTLAEQRERRRLAGVMHDHIQQLLVAAKFRTIALGGRLDGGARQATQEIENLLDECLSAARSLTAELSPPILHEGGLNAGLEWLAKRVTARQGLKVKLQMEPVGPLPEDLKVVLFESIRELLFNVVKHARTHSASVHLQHVPGRLQVTVSDYGIGFNPNTLPSVIESREGFGLFGVRERLELFGGKLDMESAPGCGTRIVLSVPIAMPAEAQAAQLSLYSNQSDVARPQSHESRKKIRILLADDHRIVRQGISTMICSQPDFEIIGEAGDGQETVALAAKLAPDIILMDVSMPKLGGIEATRVIHKEFPKICIIGLSMYEEAERAQAMRAAGAVDYLTKSGPAEDLIKTIRKASPVGSPLSGQSIA